MNHQEFEPVSDAGRETLDIHSTFYSIQGEGPFVGQPAFFIRFAGCNLQCPQCDTDYTFERQTVDVGYLLALAEQAPTDLVVITGGEPFRQPLGLAMLVETLVGFGFRVQIETNGTLPPAEVSTLAGATVVCSPKTSTLDPTVEKCIDAYKYVLEANHFSNTDGLPLRVLGMRPTGALIARPPEGFDGQVFVQPLDDAQRGRHQAAAVKVCKAHGHTLCLQIHKIIGEE